MPKMTLLRQRIIAVLASSGVAAVMVAACSSASNDGSNDGDSSSDSCTPTDEWQCFTPDELELALGQSDAGSPDAASPDPMACPALAVINHLALTPCSSYTAGPVVDGGTCCYEYTFPGCCGRPFLVGGEAILAGVEVRADWCAEIQEAAALDPTTRAALALAWLDDARLEHASIASFARFTLHLLALGAPADLVVAAQRASLDEVAHARACFALASRYAGAALGPGALPVEGSLGAVTLAGAAATAAREGCVGETIAAAVAAEQLDRATDPAARAALATIARDEAAHAELAWRFVAWALARGGDEVRSAVADAFADARAGSAGLERSVDPAGIDALAWRRHGRLARPEIRAVEWRTWREVIGPCADALISSARGAMTAAPEWHTKNTPTPGA